MSIKTQRTLKRILREEKGQSLILVLILFLAGSLSLPPLLSYMQTALKSGSIYENKTDELYAADSGIEDAIWYVNNDSLESMLTEPAYDPYDFDTIWSYELDEQLNRKDVTINIENIWIPKDISSLSKEEGRAIIESGKLVVTGCPSGESGYKIKIAFYPDAGEENDLEIDSIGVWLPLGFDYVEGSSNLEDNPAASYYDVPDIESHCGGQAITWEFFSVPFTSFPGVEAGSSPLTTEITFEINTDNPGASPTTVGWTTTSGVSEVPLSWDADAKIYRVVSQSGSTNVEAYFAKSELRELGSAIEGDYCAVGNSLMIDTNHDSYGIRDVLLTDSDAEVTDIPEDADVVAAYLYWSGWLQNGIGSSIWEDDCSDYSDWDNPANDWGLSEGRFRGHHLGSAPSWHRYLEMKNSYDLSSYEAGTVRVQWQQSEDGQLESSDALRFQFSGNDGDSWGDMITAFNNDIGSSPQSFSYAIPSEFLTSTFKMRFYLDNFGGGGEYCYVDNFAIAEVVYAPDTEVVFEIDGNQVYYDGDGQPAQGAQELEASDGQVLPNFNSDGSPNGYSYACFRDVTSLVCTYSEKAPDPATNHPGNGTYTVGGVSGDTGNQWSYAGWSLLIVYGSSETEGHQLYLYDTFMYAHNDTNIDFDYNGEPGGAITVFIVPEPIVGETYAAKLTVFVGEGDSVWQGDQLQFNDVPLSNGVSPWNNVWNSQSPGMSEDGVDIDTFNITWASGLLEPGDTSAKLELPTGSDSWNLVYIILSLRSQTVTGGTTHYVIYSGA